MRRAKQQELNLYLGKRGGARPDAGRPRGPNPRIPHKSRDTFLKRYPCHVTLRVRRGLQSLRLGPVLRAVEETFRRGRSRARLPARALLHPEQSRAPGRRGRRARGARTRHEVDRLALRARRQSGAEAARAGALRPVSLPRDEDADRRAERPPLRAPQRPQALDGEPAAAREGRERRCAGQDAGGARSRFVRALVRRLARRVEARSLAAARVRLHAGGGRSRDLAARARLAAARAARSPATRPARGPSSCAAIARTPRRPRTAPHSRRT